MRGPAATRAIVFDLDGTLLDSLPFVLATIKYAIEPFGVSPTMDIFAHLGGPPDRFLPDILGGQENVAVALRRMEIFHTENQHLIVPFGGVAALLQELRAHGVALAIWTGRDRASTEWLLATHQLSGYFSAVVCGDDLPTHKPDPAGLRAILQQLDVAPEHTLFLGDADVDVLGGVSCGVDTVLIRHTREVHASVEAKSWRSVISPAEAYALAVACARERKET